MRDAGQEVDERARAELVVLLAGPVGHGPVQQVERVGLAGVDVQGVAVPAGWVTRVSPDAPSVSAPERRGRFLCEVHVTVHKHDAVPQVGFPAGSALDV